MNQIEIYTPYLDKKINLAAYKKQIETSRDLKSTPSKDGIIQILTLAAEITNKDKETAKIFYDIISQETLPEVDFLQTMI